ncbi:MAG: hypothetical protein SFT68_01760, partial [Rickettsiaceae bacterium]|nr:hypothetical protein [Rickettsiaceae bacterium]
MPDGKSPKLTDAQFIAVSQAIGLTNSGDKIKKNLRIVLNFIMEKVSYEDLIANPVDYIKEYQRSLDATSKKYQFIDQLLENIAKKKKQAASLTAPVDQETSKQTERTDKLQAQNTPVTQDNELSKRIEKIGDPTLKKQCQDILEKGKEDPEYQKLKKAVMGINIPPENPGYRMQIGAVLTDTLNNDQSKDSSTSNPVELSNTSAAEDNTLQASKSLQTSGKAEFKASGNTPEGATPNAKAEEVQNGSLTLNEINIPSKTSNFEKEALKILEESKVKRKTATDIIDKQIDAIDKEEIKDWNNKLKAEVKWDTSKLDVLAKKLEPEEDTKLGASQPKQGLETVGQVGPEKQDFKAPGKPPEGRNTG